MSDPVIAEAEQFEICYRCQMRLPPRLVQFVIGPRGGCDAVCAACQPWDPAKREEVVAMRRAMWQK